MVRTVRPKARATPRKPMPRAGNAAARTAAPHPPKTSQNVPKNSAETFLASDMRSLSVWDARAVGVCADCIRPCAEFANGGRARVWQPEEVVLEQAMTRRG